MKIRPGFFLRVIFFSFSQISGHAEFHAETELEAELSLRNEVLFVSLGSVCQPANMLRLNGLRNTAFPFDWIVSQDGEALIEMLEDNFGNFLNDEHFAPFGPAGHLLNTHYHLEFLHDGDFNIEFDHKLSILKEKYQRRIQRFRSLRDYPGKIIFIRYAYPNSLTDQHRFYRFADNLEMSEEYTLRLYEALNQFFPNLDFSLVILNYGEKEEFEEQKQVGDHVKIFRTPLMLDLETHVLDYGVFFNYLLHDAQKN